MGIIPSSMISNNYCILYSTDSLEKHWVDYGSTSYSLRALWNAVWQ